MTNMIHNQYVVLAEYAKRNLTHDQIFALNDWLAMHYNNYESSRFLVAAGLTTHEIIAHFERRAA